MPTTATISTFGVQPGWIQRQSPIIISINQLFTLKSLTAKGIKKIVKMTNIVDNNSLRINYLCPTGMIPVFYNLKSSKRGK